MFNDILPKKMSYYNQTLGSKDLARVISDCYLELGRRETIELLDRMKSAGFRASTESGLSFGVSDLRTAPNKEKVIGESEKTVLKLMKNCTNEGSSPIRSAITRFLTSGLMLVKRSRSP
jgi:DNA-directed RNA polymerase subunit beta'